MKNYFYLLSLLILFILPAVISAQTSSKPNVLIIMADDLDSRQLSCYGGQNISTPNIDGLAAEGIKFNNMYASEAICTPIRASLFTGLYPARHGIYQNHKAANHRIKSIVQYLGKLGYAVALAGKDDGTRPGSVFPFKYLKGFVREAVSSSADYSLDSVKEFMASETKPFCLFVMSTLPHIPWTVGDPSEFNPDKLKLPPHWVDTKESRIEFSKYLAEVRQLDNQVGDILKTLKESGKDKNTLVIFLGEQGPQFPGGKWTLYNYGTQSSMIARYYGKIKPASETDALVQYEDITPTLVDLAGGRPLSGIDGKSFLPVLLGKSNTFRNYVYGIHNNIPEGSAYPIRSIRDAKYKLIENLSPEKDYYIKYSMNIDSIVDSVVNTKPISQMRGADIKLWRSWIEKAATDAKAKKLVDRIVIHPAIELYDMKKDPFELNNLAGNPEYKRTIETLSVRLNEWMKQQGDKGALMDVEIPEKNKYGNRNND